MTKRFILLILIFLTGCSNFNANNIAPGYVQAYQAIKNAVRGYENTTITRELIDNIPYASSVISIGNGPIGLMILESIKGNESVWITADEIYFVIKKGKIVETKGLSNNLSNLLLPSYFEDSDLRQISQQETLNFYYSYDEPELIDLEVKVNYTNMGLHLVNILGDEKELILVKEKISNDYIGWQAENKYWIDDTGYVWKSQQYISPKLPIINYEITKKPSK